MFSHEQYDALHEAAGLLNRSGRGRLVLTGSDRRAYLHGLLTNDILALVPGTGAYAALLTPQGRMISDLRVSELGDRILIDLPGETADAVRTRLADFVFAEDVEVHDARTTLDQLGLYGPRAADVLAAGVAPDKAGQAAARERLVRLALHGNDRVAFGGRELWVVASDDYGVPGFELFVDAPVSDALAEACRAAGAREVSRETLHVTRVEAGRPEFGADMDATTIPLEAGIEDRAISLTKGCYVGQEIIIRVLHRGQGRVARRLVGVIGDPADGEIPAGERLQHQGREVGTVTSGAISPRLRRPIALALVHRDHAEPGRVLQRGGAGGGTTDVTIVSLPFTTA